MIRASRPNTYSGSLLDRAGHLRGNDAWIAAAWRNAGAKVIVLWHGQGLVNEGALCLLEVTAMAALREHPWALLGLNGSDAIFALDLSALVSPRDVLPPQGDFAELRPLASLLAAPEAAMLAQARAHMHWRARHRFCGVCGHPCRPEQAGHVLVCTGCATHHFPRTDAAVIMLVTRGDRALLGRSARFPGNMFSTLAGFIEAGESLEEAVAREVFEEVGVRIGAVQYHSSQPWPFPANIMLGFYAAALGEQITIDPGEIEEARWFTRAEMAAPDAHGFAMPPPQSIARRLIEDWLAG